jgi:integrase
MTTHRRRAGEGSIRPYSTRDGTRHEIVWRVPDPATGKTRQRSERGFTTERAASTALRQRLAKVDTGTYVEPSKQRLADYLTTWLDGLRLEPSTVASYGRNVRLHIVPALGGTSLAMLNAPALTAFYRTLETEPSRRDGSGKALKARTIRYIHTILHSALDDAVEGGLLVVNPADRAKPPRAKDAEPPEMHTWSVDELGAFLTWSIAKKDDLFVAWLLLVSTGLRRGELLGLRWSDIDLTARKLNVRRSLGWVRDNGEGRIVEGDTKTKGSRRTVDLDDGTVTALRAYRSARSEIALSLVRDSAYVISHPDGSPRHPERFSKEFGRRQERCRRDLTADGKPAPSAIRLHDLRHTQAVLGMEAGIHPKVMQERLGHAKVSITLDIYSHATPTMQREAADLVGALVHGGNQ